MSDAPGPFLSYRPEPSVVRVITRVHGRRGWPASLSDCPACVIEGERREGSPSRPRREASGDGFGEKCGTLCPGVGEVRRRARSGILREQGVLGECGTMARARRETPGGAGGVANDDPALGVQRGGAFSGPAEGPWRVWEGGASPERRIGGAGVRGRQTLANDSWNAGPKGRSAS